MRLNGGIIGKSNEPTNRVASGIWSSEEQRVSQLYGKFPRYYEGWDLTYLVNTTPRLLSTTSMSGIGASGGMDFKPDGTVLYVLDTGSGSELSQYSLSTPWDPATASLSGSLGSIVVQQGVAFRADGLAFFVGGSSSPPVRQYSMSSPWTVSTGVLGKVISVAQNFGITFSTDGMFLYTMDVNSILRQYSLTSPFDVSTATSLRTFSMASTDNAMRGIFFKPDGLSFYTAGDQFDQVRQYNLSTAWNISTASLFGGSSLAAAPTSIFFRDDGTRMYVSTGSAIVQYNLSTAWNVTTAASSASATIPANPSATPNPGETSVTSFVFKPDGTRIFVTGLTTDRIQEISMVTPWQIGTFTHVSSSAIIDTVPKGIFINPDGLRLYYVADSVNRLFENALAPAYSLSGFSSGGININSSILDIAFSPDNTKFYALYANFVAQYDLAQAGDLASYPITTLGTGGNAAFGFSAQLTNANGLAFSSDGLCMYVSNSSRVFKYNLLYPWAISSASFAYSYLAPTTSTIVGDVALKSDNSELYLQTGTEVLRFSLPVAKELRSPGDEGGFLSVNAQEVSPTGITFSPDGTNMYIVGNNGQEVNQFSLSTAWNVTTASFVRLFSVSAQDSVPTDVKFKPDGSVMYVLGSSGDDVNQYSLSTPWDISTASFVQLFLVSGQETVPSGLEFKPDGTKMYIVGSTGDDVNEYNLSTAWDISTASFVQIFSVAAQESAPQAIAFRPDGLRMFILGEVSDSIHQYDLSTPWNISTATFSKSLTVMYLETIPTGLAFKADGTKLYLVGQTADTVYELSLG